MNAEMKSIADIQNEMSEPQERFGISPVRNAYFKKVFERSKSYIWDSPIKPMGGYVRFKRFDNLLTESERAYLQLDVLVKALFGFEENDDSVMGHADIEKLNLRSTERENTMMDSFLRGISPELKKEWESNREMKSNIGVDVTSELKDLLQVYTQAEEHLKEKESASLNQLNGYMKRYLEVQEERKKITEKLNALKFKMNPAEDDEGDDE